MTNYLINCLINIMFVLLDGTNGLPGNTPQYGTGVYPTADLLLANYTDLGTSATLSWTKAAGATVSTRAAVWP